MTNIQRRNLLIYLAFGLLLFGGTYYTLRTFQRRFPYSPQARIEMKHLFGRLQLGQTKSQVQSVFKSGNYQKLKMGGSPEDNDWGVSTPFEFGSGNWVLLIDFDRNHKITALKIRTIDSHQERPREPAPADKIAP